MASLFTLRTSDGTTTYYGSVYIDGKRYRKKLSTTKSTAQKMLTQYERELAINPFVTNHLEFSIKTGAELVRIRKCELLVSHAQIRQNYSKFLHACYLSELLLFCEIPVVESEDYFNLLKRTISQLSEFDNCAEIKLNFEMQLLKLLGISPSLISCTVCENFLWKRNSGELMSTKYSIPYQLDAIQGGIRCPDCCINSTYTVALHPGSLSFLYNSQSGRKNGFKIKPTQNNLKELDQALNLYFSHFFGRNLKSYSLLKDNSWKN